MGMAAVSLVRRVPTVVLCLLRRWACVVFVSGHVFNVELFCLFSPGLFPTESWSEDSRSRREGSSRRHGATAHGEHPLQNRGYFEGSLRC